MILIGTNMQDLLHIFHGPGPVLGAWHALLFHFYNKPLNKVNLALYR